MVTSGNVTGLTDRLEQRGLVARERAARTTGAPGRPADAEGPRALRGAWPPSIERWVDGADRRARSPTRDRDALRRCSASSRQLGPAREPAGLAGRQPHDPDWPGIGAASTSAGRSTGASRRSRSTGPSARIRSPSTATPSSATCSARCATPTDVKAVVLAGAGGNFCSGGDVHEIIGPLTQHGHAGAARLHAHDRRPGEGDARLPAADRRRGRRRLRRRRRDHRHGLRPPARHAARRRPRSCSPASGLAGCDMGACAILPRIIGQGRAAELLYTGRAMTARGRRALGLLQPARRARGAARRGQRAGAPSSPPARPSPTA